MVTTVKGTTRVIRRAFLRKISITGTGSAIQIEVSDPQELSKLFEMIETEVTVTLESRQLNMLVN